MGANCLALVRSQVRTIGTRPPMHTSTKFAARFALLVRTLLRETGANHEVVRLVILTVNSTKSR